MEEVGHETTKSNTGEFVRTAQADVLDEESDQIVGAAEALGVTMGDLTRGVIKVSAKVCASWYLKQV